MSELITLENCTIMSTAFCTFSANKKRAAGYVVLRHTPMASQLDHLNCFPFNLTLYEDAECILERLMKDPHILSHIRSISNKQVGDRFLLVDDNVLRTRRRVNTYGKHGLRESASDRESLLLQIRRTLVVVRGFADNRYGREHLMMEGTARFDALSEFYLQTTTGTENRADKKRHFSSCHERLYQENRRR